MKSIECFFSDVLFKIYSKPAGKKREKLWLQRFTVSCAVHLQRLISCFGIFVLYIASEGCLHTHYSTALILLCFYEMNEWLRSVLDSVVCQVALLNLGRSSLFIFEDEIIRQCRCFFKYRKKDECVRSYIFSSSYILK